MMTRPGSSRWLTALIIAALAALATGALTRGIVSHAPLYDELLHIEAAKGILATGEPVILDGEYQRAHAYSVLTAWALEAGDGSLSAARMPAVLATMLLAGLLAFWTTLRVGVVAGAAAAACLLLLPLTPQLAVFARFYTLHALCCFVALICAYEMTEGRRTALTMGLLAVTAVMAAALAFHLQSTSVIAIGSGFIALVAAVVVDRWKWAGPLFAAHWGKIIAGTLVTAAVVLGAAYAAGLLDAFFESALWASGRNVQFYNALLRSSMPLLWPLLPVAALLALLQSRKLAVFCIAAFAIPLILHSLAAQKTFRYIYYALPFACVLWGAGIARASAAIRDQATRLFRIPAFGTLAAVLILCGALVLSEEGTAATKLLTGRTDYRTAFPAAFEADWGSAESAVRAQIEPGTLIIASSGVKAVNVFGNYDYELNSSVVLETETGEEFGRDPRTGRQVIGTTASLLEVLSRPGPAVIISDSSKLGNANHIGAEVVEQINSLCDAIATPRESAVSAWRCLDR